MILRGEGCARSPRSLISSPVSQRHSRRPHLVFASLVFAGSTLVFASRSEYDEQSLQVPPKRAASHSEYDQQSFQVTPKQTSSIRNVFSNCFVEGLFFRDKDTLVESCGLTGKSILREFVLEQIPPPVPPSGPTTRMPSWLENVPKPHTVITTDGTTKHLQTKQTKTQNLSPAVFAEGTVDLGAFTYSLTYKKKEIHVYDKKTWAFVKTLPWPHGEGWGLSTDGCRLLGTTGDEYLYHISPEDGRLLKKVLFGTKRSRSSVVLICGRNINRPCPQ